MLTLCTNSLAERYSIPVAISIANRISTGAEDLDGRNKFRGKLTKTTLPERCLLNGMHGMYVDVNMRYKNWCRVCI